jgi:molybdate transport system permease protein
MQIINKIELEVIQLSIQVALISTLVVLPVSMGLAWVMARKKFKGKNIVEGIISLPLVAPPVVTGYLLLWLLGSNGLLGKWLLETWNMRLSFNFIALIIASAVVSLPLAVRTIKSAFELIDPVYEKASATLGVSRWGTFTRVSLPLALPGIISGMVLAFARSLGEFGATITFAGNIQGETRTIPLMIYSNMQVPGKEWEVTRLVIFAIGISIFAVMLAEIFKNKKNYLTRTR